MTGLKWLHLEHTNITDAGVGQLANLKNLETLSLKYTGITDESLVHLERLTSLAELVLNKTKITAAGADRIRRALPNCTVVVTFGLGQTPADITLFPDGHQPTANDMNAKFKELGIDGQVWADTSQAGSPIIQLYLSKTALSDQAALRLVAQTPRLKTLTVSDAFFGNEFVIGLHGIQQLSRLGYRTHASPTIAFRICRA